MSTSTEIQRLKQAKADIKTALENKGVEVGSGTIDTYAEKINEISAGGGDYEQGFTVGSFPLYHAATCRLIWNNAIFPENTDLVVKVKGVERWDNSFYNTTNLRSIKLISDTPNLAIFGDNLFRQSPQLELIDLTEFNRKFTSMGWFVLNNTNLKTILGALDLSECTSVNTAFSISQGILEDIEFVPNTIKITIDFKTLQYLTDKSIQSIIDGLADLTGQTAQKITWHSSIIAKLTPEQATQMYSKNWEFG